MFKELMYKMFGLEPFPCNGCEILRTQLDESNRERRELLQKLLVQPEPPAPSIDVKELQPLTRGYVPWRVRQQMLEAEDKKKAELLKRNAQEIEDLEKELNVGTTGE